MQHSESPSQPSSPIGSRSSSPKINLQHQQQNTRHSSHRADSRSSSFDATGTQQNQQYIENEISTSHSNKLNSDVSVQPFQTNQISVIIFHFNYQ